MESATPGKKTLWLGIIISILGALPFVPSAIMKFMAPPQVVEGMKHLGLPEYLTLPLGIVELACVILYLIPTTSVLGAVLLTGYLGGAILTHLRVGEAIHIPIIIGGLVWLGIYLREPRLRDLLPLRKNRS